MGARWRGRLETSAQTVLYWEDVVDYSHYIWVVDRYYEINGICSAVDGRKHVVLLNQRRGECVQGELVMGGWDHLKRAGVRACESHHQSFDS